MLKLLVKSLFLALILSLLYFSVIFFTPYSKEFAYNYRTIKEFDKNKIGWTHKRLRQTIDYAFIGSSHTFHGVDDNLIQKIVHDSSKNGSISVSNISRSWPGRNLDYLVIKELLKLQRPRIIFIEVTERFPFGGHLYFPILAENKELFDVANLNNVKLGRDIQTAFKSRLDCLVANLFHIESVSSNTYFYKEHGYAPAEGKFDGKKDTVEERSLFVKNYIPSLHNYLFKINHTFYDNYINKIISLAFKCNVQIIFLYIPRYKPPYFPEEYIQWKEKYQYWIPPIDIFNDADNFADSGHLNPKGAKLLSTWIAEEIIKNMKQCK